MNMLKLVVCVAALAGCATQGNQRNAAQEAMDAQSATCRSSFQSPSVDSIRSKIPLVQGLERPTLEILADRNFPDELQKAAIVDFDARVIQCANGWAGIFATYGGQDYAALHQR